MTSRHRSLKLTVRAMLGLPMAGAVFTAHAADVAEERWPIPTITVSATAMNEDSENIASSFSVLDGERLFERTQATLGDTLDGIPSVHSDTFGGGATRPVIRGQSAPRVKVLSDSASILDASDISPDHAITTEPLLIDKVEVLRGPATLLYGSGAIGGVVNVLDKKIPTALPEDGLDGSIAVRAGSVAREKAAAAELSAQIAEHWVMHVEGTARDADDYRVPDWDERRVDGTSAESGSGSVGLSWIGDNGYLGLAYSYRDDEYGLPGHSHEYEGCHPHGSSLHCGSHDADDGDHDHDHDHEHAEAPTIDLLSKRVDLRGEANTPFAGIERIRLRASHTDYRHHELEEGVVATTFLNDGYEARIEVQHVPFGRWSGVIGAQYSDTEFSALGEEAFMPVTKTQSTGVFVVEHYELSEIWHFEVGARQEWLKHRPVNDARARPEYSETATSVSAAAIWELVPDYHLTLSTARSERLPHAQELYARGIHLATNTYECGLMPHPLTCGGLENNAALDIETSNNVELSLRKTAGNLTFSVGAYYNKVDDYIYARTLDQFEAFRLVKYTQGDAEFRGFEAEATYRFDDNLSLTFFGDRVRAELDEGGNLPRIPGSRYGTRLNASIAAIGGELEYYRVNEQEDIADYEVVTPSYDMLDLTFSYSPAQQADYSIYLRGTNLLDEQIWNHSSFLANVVPLPGRSVSVGMKLSF